MSRYTPRRLLLTGLSIAAVGAVILWLTLTADDLAALLTRFAWLGALTTGLAWMWAAHQVWIVEGSLHHLIARILSIVTMVSLDVAILIFFWPGDAIDPIITLTPLQARMLVAFIVGMQAAAVLWQLTAPKQGRTKREGRRSN